MRRDNLFRRVSKGGLSLSHVFVRQTVSRFMFLREQTNPFLWTVIQMTLADAIPFFVVSSCSPEHRKLSSFLREVVEACRFLSVRFSLQYLSTVTRKRLTRDLIESVFPEPLYRSMFHAGPERNVLSRVKKMTIAPSIKTFLVFSYTPTHSLSKFGLRGKKFTYRGALIVFCAKNLKLSNMFFSTAGTLSFSGTSSSELSKKTCL